MAFRESELQTTRVEHPEKWRALIRIAIQKHGGVLKRAANELDVSYSTLKRWLIEEPTLRELVNKVRAIHARKRK
jgi:transcriptional regulator with PAS, ATPase and Fis domain